MNCDQAELLLGPYCDGELDAAGILELEPHLQSCPACNRAWRDAQELKRAMNAGSLYFKAPAAVHRRVRDEIRGLPKPPPRQINWAWTWNWLNAAGIAAAAAGVAFLLGGTLTRPGGTDRLAGEIVASHVRSLMADHALDVASSDQHTVKPWFDGKLDFAPPVKDLAALQFPLAGGRLDYLDGRPVAALVFKRSQHVINLFIWPAKETLPEARAMAPIKGYNLVRWSQSGMSCWAVSDLNGTELMEFARDFAR